MTAAKKYDIEGPIGLQLNKKQYAKMLQQIDAAMQKALDKKRISKSTKSPGFDNKLEKVNKMLSKTKWLDAE